MKYYTDRQVHIQYLLRVYSYKDIPHRPPKMRKHYNIKTVRKELKRFNPNINLKKISFVDIIKYNRFSEKEYKLTVADMKGIEKRREQWDMYYEKVESIIKQPCYTITDMYRCNLLFSPITAKPYKHWSSIVTRIKRIPKFEQVFDIKTRKQCVTREQLFELNGESMMRHAQANELPYVPGLRWECPPFKRVFKKAITPDEMYHRYKQLHNPFKPNPIEQEKEEEEEQQEEEKEIRENRNTWLPASYTQ